MINPEKISILERTHRLVKEFAEGYPSELTNVKPDDVAFSATEIVCHLADVERLWHKRFADIDAQGDGVVFTAMNPDEVAKQNQYNSKTLDAALADWTALREETYGMAKNFSEDVLHRVAIHPRYGEMVIFRMFDIMANHDLQHLEQMKRTLKQVSA